MKLTGAFTCSLQGSPAIYTSPGWVGGGDGGRGGEIELSAKHLIDLKGESISPPGDREYRLRQPIF